MKKEYLKKLNKAFKDFKFYEQDHHYEYKGKRIGISVTQLIEEYSNEFDADLIAEKVALKQGKSVQEVLDEWEYKNKFACTKGSTCHEFAQHLWSGNEYTFKEFDNSESYFIATELITTQACNFHNDYENKLEHLADEFVIGSEEYDIASAVDHLFVDKETKGIVLVDYKTNTDIFKDDKYASKMKAPLQHLKDTKLNHYFLQVSIYKYLIEKYSDLEIEKMFIVWLSEMNDDYEIIDVPYLKEEVKNILEWNKWK